jgi:hypothetical protein
MRSSNLAIRKAVYDILAPIAGVPVYYKYIPARVETNAYILITTINANNASTINSHDTENTIQVGIYTKDSNAISGLQADSLADIIINNLVPRPASTIIIDGFQNCGISMVSENSPGAIQLPDGIAINHFITFRILLGHPMPV